MSLLLPRNAGHGACQPAVCRDRSRRGYGDDDSCCWQRSRSSERSQCGVQGAPRPRGRCRPRRLSPVGGRAALAAREEIHLGEGCCGGRRRSGTALTGRSCWQAAVSRVAAALQHQLTFGELLPVPLRRSRGSAVPSDGARTCRGGRLQPDYKSLTRSQPPEPKCLCLAHQPALSAFISSPCVYEGGFLLRAAAVRRNANGERAAAALRSPWQAISSGPGPRPRWL